MKYVFIIISFILGWIACFNFIEPKTVTVYQDKIITNTITKNIKDMSYEEAKADLYCFYTGFPSLKIDHIGGEEYLQSASLCEREWSRQTTIKSIYKQYKNMIIGGIFVDSQMRTGLNAQYYRFYGRMGFGGGLSFGQGYEQLNGGVAWLW
jgi:hypothetical protein